MSRISPGEAERFARDGHLRLPAVVDSVALAALRAAMERVSAGVPAGACGRIVHDPWRREPVLREALLAGVLPELARTLLGEDPVLFQDVLVSKLPGSAQIVQWHQDYSYWPLDRPRGLTLWLALDDACEDNGCLRYLSGSQHGGERQPADFVAGARQPPRPGLPPLEIHGEGLPVAARAGDLLLHDPLVLHMSGPNRSRRERRAWSISWVTAATRWAPDHAAHPYLWELAPSAGEELDRRRFPRVRGGDGRGARCL